MQAQSKLGLLYQKIYDAICGKHPHLLPWHFQFLVSSELGSQLKRSLYTFSGRVLDAGCGQKPYGFLLPLDVEHIGIDISENSKADFIIDGNSKWPFENAYFDYIISNDVIEHVENLDLYISEITRCLKPNGLLLITVPFICHEHGLPYDFRRYTIEGVKRLWGGAILYRKDTQNRGNWDSYGHVVSNLD